MRQDLYKLSILFLIVSISFAQDREFTFYNYCDEDVWWGFTSGSVTAKSGSGTICSSDDDCYQGSSCVQTGDIS